ncbi:MAG: tetratricopeptide repeat protein, partial [Acidobacteria bacterium]|nr:tetratricopeptide repeat protein [Acidobacteriota bacterium]
AGSVQRQDDRVLVALNLIDATTLRQKRSRVISERVGDLAGAGDRVVDALVSMLDVELAAPGRSQIVSGGTREPEAWDQYVQALGVLRGTQRPGEPDRAALLFKRAIALDPTFVRAHAGLAEAYLDTYRRDKDVRLVEQAVASIERAAALDSQVTAIYLTKGKINAATGNYEEAVRDFRRVLKVEPKNSDAFGGLGRALESLGRDREAEASYQRAIELKPAHWLGYTVLGNFYFRQARYDEAVRQHRRVIALTPENSWGYNNLGAVYFGLGRIEEARGMFERSAAIKPNYAAFSNLGSIHFQTGAFAEAAPFFEKALAINPQDYSLWGNMATCYHFLPDRQDQALAAYRRAVELAEKERQVDERDPNLLVDLAGYEGMLGERAKGLALLDQALKAPPTSAELMCAVGQSFEDLGERKRALEWIGKALSAGYPRAGIEGSPALQNLTRDPRYRGLLRAIARRK